VMGWRRTVVVAGFAALVGACGGSSRGGQSSIDTGPGQLSRQEVVDLLSGESVDALLAGELLTECMAERGFLWVGQGVGGAAELGDAEFVARYGYGIATAALLGESSPEPDPNLAYADSLNASALAAYNVALVGNEAGASPISPESCLGKENAALAAASDTLSSPEATALLEEFAAALDTDGGVVAARVSWTECMGQRGYESTGSAALAAGIQQRVDNAANATELEAIAVDELQIAADDFECSAPLGPAIDAATEAIVEEVAARYDE
jgi:hypothetical protein